MTPFAQIDALLAQKSEIDALLARLQAWSDEHFDTNPDTVTWTDVSTVQEVASNLRRVTDFAFAEGECA